MTNYFIEDMEKEEDRLTVLVNTGKISELEYIKQMNDLQREYREMAQDAAHQAYDDELDRW